MTRSIPWRWLSSCCVVLGTLVACDDEQNPNLFGSGSGVPATGGDAATGGATTGGDTPTDTGGEATGGSEGGASSGGDATGGDETGGSETGGSETGGDETGGGETGGDATGGEASGGTAGASSGGDETGGAGGAASGGGETGGAGGGGGEVSCTTARMDPCGSIPRFEGRQTVDGSDADLCSLPTFVLNFTDGDVYVHVDHEGSNDAGNKRQETATVRLGWSEAGLHGFVTVTDAFLFASGRDDPGYIWNGDGVEVFVAGSASGLTGNSGRDAVTHVQFGAAPSLAAAVKTVDGSASHSALPASQYVTSVVSGGYTIEFLLPWAGGAPSSGAEMAFDLALNSADNEPAGAPDGRDAQAILHNGSPGGASPCGDNAEPWCDDRTWCTPTAG